MHIYHSVTGYMGIWVVVYSDEFHSYRVDSITSVDHGRRKDLSYRKFFKNFKVGGSDLNALKVFKNSSD